MSKENILTDIPKHNYVEFVDCNEVKNCLIATNEKQLSIKHPKIIEGS